MTEQPLAPDFLFEVSWEICNKVGGINTVIATKSVITSNEYKDNYILMGPDLWRETRKNPVFIEDDSLFKDWKNKAKKEGLRIRIGRWDIASKPIVILVDFTTFISKRDEIFSRFWEEFKLDSISGGMDYIEAAMFGYASGVVIESFYKHNLTIRDKVLAHFHEWMSGAGILYLHNKVPQIGSVFTTHATVVGRSVAGNGQDLYGNLNEYNGDIKARELNIVAKQSLEKISANTADCFTTVSEITALECKQFLEKEVDVITPNGFEDHFVPQGEQFDEKRLVARQKLLEVAEALFGYEISPDSLLIANSGRYEFYNKGIDVFIQSLSELRNRNNLQKEVVAFILVPANNYGPKKDLFEKLNKGENFEIEDKIVTHGLHDPEFDQILNEIKHAGFNNSKDEKVKIIYVPSYLDGYDGIFNLKYYDILIGLDLTIFPSYYEPWGYTPLESIAFSVPTVTTNLAGIGMWVNKELVNINDGIDVFERKTGRDSDLINKIVERIMVTIEMTPYDRQRARENAYSISRIALWKNLIRYYKQSHQIALSKVQSRSDKFVDISLGEQVTIIRKAKVNKPIWKQIIVQSKMPDALKGLDEMSKNLWMGWNYTAQDLFESIDSEIWREVKHNPILFLKEVSYERLTELLDDETFMMEYNRVYGRFQKYMKATESRKGPKIAYFSMEYGLTDLIKIYSGGLGILAGDYLKEASDINIDMVGIGFLYKFGYFTQQLSLYGEQLASYEPQVFNNLPLHEETDENGEPLLTQVALPGRVVYAKIWRVDVGRIPLYLLDTDIKENNKEDRKISHILYGGDNEYRLKQEMILGIGGIRALRALGVRQEVYHCNEGHAAFIGLERLRHLIHDKSFTFAESLEVVRSSTLFTTHTPVPAGHDSFPQDLMMVYMGHYPERLNISWEEFMDLGRMTPGNQEERFSMSYLAVNLSQEVNGVSMLHGDVTKQMFKNLWRGYYPEELHIGYVTNGVHFPSWISKEWKKLYIKYFGLDFMTDQANHEHWAKIYKAQDSELWKIKQSSRKALIDHIKHSLSNQLTRRHINPKTIMKVVSELSENSLTIGFARRFATYKRAYLLFEDLDRLAKIMNDKNRPVQFLFAGKAHPADQGGQALIKRIIEVSQKPEFIGRIIFLENYDIELAKKLVSGVDIWLNTPTRPLEASGTSGMKAVMNGVLNFSVLDGWWVEGYKDEAGWALPQERTFSNQDFQDDLDAETIYNKFEQEIVPLFYDRNEENVPEHWVQFIKKNIAEIVPDFTTKRMIDDYISRFYNKLAVRTKTIRENDFEKARLIAAWKKRITRGWENIEVKEVKLFPSVQKDEIEVGKTYKGLVVLDLHELSGIDFGVELVMASVNAKGEESVVETTEFDVVRKDGSEVEYKIEIEPNKSGVFNYGIRFYPKHSFLPHRMDFSYVKWI